MKFSVKNLSLVFSAIVLLVFLKGDGHAISPALSQPPKVLKEEYFIANVVEILNVEEIEVAGYKTTTQTLGLTIENGHEKGKDVAVQFMAGAHGSEAAYELGEKVIVQKITATKESVQYQIIDRYRMDFIGYIFILFLLIVVFIAGKKGIGSILGMFFSLFVLVGMIAPLIIAGYNPLLVSIGGALIIMVLSIYLAHGISKQTTSAIISTFIALVLSGLLSFLFVEISKLTGVGSEDSYSLQFGLSTIDLKGLLLGGIIIGTLGILDDITTSQAAIVFELHKANAELSYRSLVRKGLNVGREHVAALVNTLFLVYAGVSLGLFVIFVLNPLKQPTWVLLNYQSVSEEIVRALVGSIVLILAVPLSTVIAAITVKRMTGNDKKSKK